MSGLILSVRKLIADKIAAIYTQFAGSNGSALVGHLGAGAGAIPENIKAILNRRGIDVRSHGAGGVGGNDLTALKNARLQAGLLNVPLILSRGRYGVDDIFIYSEDNCSVVVFEEGAEIVLLQASTVGGATAAQGVNTPTRPLYVFNPTVDCQNIAGENAIGMNHPVSSTFYNVKVRNVKASNVSFGGKAIQWEGGKTVNSKVYGLDIDGATVGIDIGAEAGVQTVGIGIFSVQMRNVDIPIHTNDTTTNTPSNSRDQLEAVIDGLTMRNCGKLTYTGATATGGGMIVQERGHGLTVRNWQLTNDRGGYGGTAYGGIGALVRGQGQGLILENGHIDADMTALIDFNPATFQSPFVGDIASFVMGDNIRHTGNLDYVMKSMSGGGKIGPGALRRVEIGSTSATLAGILDANAGAYANHRLELIDRDAGFKTTGLKKLSDLFTMGNTLALCLGEPATVEQEGAWTPIDASGAGLTFTAATGWFLRTDRQITLWGQVTYPTTANAVAAKIGGFPVAVKNQLYARAGGNLTISTVATVARIYPESGGTSAPLLNSGAGAVTNATCSGGTYAFCITYPLT